MLILIILEFFISDNLVARKDPTTICKTLPTAIAVSHFFDKVIILQCFGNILEFHFSQI